MRLNYIFFTLMSILKHIHGVQRVQCMRLRVQTTHEGTRGCSTTIDVILFWYLCLLEKLLVEADLPVACMVHLAEEARVKDFKRHLRVHATSFVANISP